ncbi:MAG: Rha family transcriptional regulator [Methylobacter sp.]|uniref:Rha family transcriptional regulator n=1 Tax=Methylobacter sp. TaxID=2051955 RepID=UPI0027320BAA|nr:Rha family transcriptional regulator [Methylobacter sp.]MDP1664998.1 Rha family transcriptional regulator [Methylobacter sp.]
MTPPKFPVTDSQAVLMSNNENNPTPISTNTSVPAIVNDFIIRGGSNQICVDSRDIAKQFGRDHKNVLQTLDDLLADGTISRLEFKLSNYVKRGKEYRRYELNKAGFLKAMPFIGGRKSREGQRRFVDEFLRIEAAFERQSKERASLAYQVARSSGKDSRGILTDEIKTFIAYAKEQGSSNADRYFCTITNVVQKSILVIDPHVTQVRELLTAIQLANLSLIELTSAQALTKGMEAKLPYKEIYQKLKNALDRFVVERTRVLGD